MNDSSPNNPTNSKNRARFLFAPFLLVALLFASFPISAGDAPPQPRPNILWLVNEDHGPDVGCYGDAYATTPTFDHLASKGIHYLHAWSCAPVCAPARTTLISGIFAPSLGGEHMRSHVPYPAGLQMYPQLLRAAGYYCSNNAKEDYNTANPGKVWDESSKKAHWRNRAPGQPFMAVFNFEQSHESKIRIRPHKAIHDPAKVRVPGYHPDTPEVRQDWAQYYDCVTEADAAAGKRLKELEDAGLLEDTIIFYYADHGSGMPGNKRLPYNRGLQVPLVVYIPEKFKDLRPPEYVSGGTSDRLVSFVDFAPTLLSLAGVKPPEWMQGHAFIGKYIEPPQPFIYGFRGRMDERYDMMRTVTDGRYVYVRNYMPELIYGQHCSYMFETPTTRVWKKLHDEGKLNPAQDKFWNPKPPEELFDLQTDRDELINLADKPGLQSVKAKLRKAQQDLARRIRDAGFMPESERVAYGDKLAPYDLGRDDSKYPFDRIFATAEEASMLKPEALPDMRKALADSNLSVRYWGAMGILMRGKPAVAAAREDLLRALKDEAPTVRITAAQALAQFGADDDAKPAIAVLLECANWSRHDLFTATEALNSIGFLGPRLPALAADIKALPLKGPIPSPKVADYVPRLIEDLESNLK